MFSCSLLLQTFSSQDLHVLHHYTAVSSEAHHVSGSGKERNMKTQEVNNSEVLGSS